MNFLPFLPLRKSVSELNLRVPGVARVVISLGDAMKVWILGFMLFWPVKFLFVGGYDCSFSLVGVLSVLLVSAVATDVGCDNATHIL